MRKFIITSNDEFRYGDVNMHRDLLHAHEGCLGGGMYEFDYVRGKMLLYGKSYDYGRPKWNMVNSLILPLSLQGFDIEYEECSLQSLVPIEYR